MSLRGFRFAGVAAGLKESGRPDVALAVSDGPCAGAAVFTRNRFRAAPVLVSEARARRGRVRGVVANSGNANACTGARGLADARHMVKLAAAATEVPADEMCVASTGVIGVPLPMGKIQHGILAAAERLAHDGFDRFAEAILTTDKGPKTRIATLRLGRRQVTIAGCAKGAGMIAPDMATTLAFVFTDAAARPSFLRRVLRQEVTHTFNSVSVDGDTSTNDSLFLLANGASDAPLLGADDAAGEKFRAALREVLLDLARALVRDGEGATHLVRIDVVGAKTAEAARAIGRRIAASPLVKTALFGADPNWGRILAAVGNAGVPIHPGRVDLDIGEVAVVRGGVGVAAEDTEARAHDVMTRAEYTIRIDLHAGRAQASVWTCDLGHEYVRINADYRT